MQLKHVCLLLGLGLPCVHDANFWFRHSQHVWLACCAPTHGFSAALQLQTSCWAGGAGLRLCQWPAALYCRLLHVSAKHLQLNCCSAGAEGKRFVHVDTVVSDFTEETRSALQTKIKEMCTMMHGPVASVLVNFSSTPTTAQIEFTEAANAVCTTFACTCAMPV